jgi:hypothetical protein
MAKKKDYEVNPPKSSVSKGGQKKGSLPPVFRKWHKCPVCGALIGPGESCEHLDKLE